MHTPTREELHQLVDQQYRAWWPDAPTRLNASAGHREWREKWRHVRDEVLNDEVNRLYWATQVDAPLKIDPDDRAHDRFQRAWLDIREQIMCNRPDPDVDDGGIDPSYLRGGFNESIVGVREQLHPDVLERLERSVDVAILAVLDAFDAGLIPSDGSYWESPDPIQLRSDTDPQHGVRAWPKATHRDGQLFGHFSTLIDNPLTP
jgi:hypothetical protein